MKVSPEMIAGLAARLMRQPAVPYYEHGPRSEVQRICREWGIDFEQDRFGNILAAIRSRPAQRPIVLAAHLDHPGFEITAALGASRWLARFQGGVPDDYFRPGTALRLMPEGIPAKLGPRRPGPERVFEVHARRPANDLPQFAVWELEDFALRGKHIHGRACDDLIGVAAALAALIQLKQSRARVHALALISRAEEIGFHGALAAAASGGLPQNSLVLSLETSRELPGVKMGQGVILRVGDRTSIFNPEATRFLAEIASDLAVSNRHFKFQRALMSGGTCEATAYQELGFQTAALCVALGNYHNCSERLRIAAEFVSLPDVCGMVEFLVEAALSIPKFDSLTNRLPQRLKRMLHEAQPRLIKTARNVR